ncbi:PDZ domain-containing protein [Sphingomonadaceae bacterium LXI357]|uniref:PDZ domain-containing protein n=2 Tax=Stakelama marina TaxID=2826939 RepID=A0A8T4I9H2_9SPHN|nr:PDZ domain-containing protein [Stakelama marina]
MSDYRPSPRQIKTGLDMLTALMIVSVAFALAGLTWRLAGHAGVGAITVPSAGRPVAVTTDIGPAVALAPFGKSAIGDNGVPTSIEAELKGVIFAIPASLSTAFIAVGNDAPQNFGVGDSVGGATIAAIRRDRVILNNGGRIEYLALPDPTKAAGADQNASASPVYRTPPPGATPPAPTATQPSADDVMARFGATATGNGIRVGDNAPAGLQPGDVISSVNGTPVTDAASARAAYTAAQQSGSAQIQILRDGKTITVTVPTR